MSLGDVKLRTSGSTVIAQLSGEVDASNAQGIGQAITRGIAHDAAVLVLDLSELEYLDSAGIQLIYQLEESLRARAQHLKLVVGTDSPSIDALRLAGITSQLDLIETVDQALAAEPS